MGIEQEIRGLNKSHWPSYSRSLARLAKKVVVTPGEIPELLKAAKDIGDPYYRATTLASIAVEINSAGLVGYQDIFDAAFEALELVDPDWRRAEALESVSGKVAKAGITDFKKIITIFYSVREVQKAPEAARGIIKNMAKVGSPNLMDILGFRMEDKDKLDLIRAVANELSKNSPGEMLKLDEHVNSLVEPLNRGKGWGYIFFKISKTDRELALAYLEQALEEASAIDDDQVRVELLNYITDNLANTEIDGWSRLENSQVDFNDPYSKARFLGHLAGKMSTKDSDRSIVVFDDALATCSEINEPADKTKALLNVGKGMKKSGMHQYESTFETALNCAMEVRGEIGDGLIRKVKRELGQETGLDTESKVLVRDDDEYRRTMGRFLILGLVNTYEKKRVIPAQVRAIARAAPLCWAYGLHLALVDFPFNVVEAVVDSVKKDTQVGRGGEFLERLYTEGLIYIPDDPSSLGTIVATTSHPDDIKRVDDLTNISGDVCFLLGVGKLGLPKRMINDAEHHLEFTGKDIPLETCTAMGILCHILGGLERE